MWRRRRRANSTSSLADLEVTLLTTSGVAERPAISSDGKWVAYVQSDSEGDSLWLRQTTTTSNGGSSRPSRGVTLFGATFTPDGTAVDFVRGSLGPPVRRGNLRTSGAWRFWAALLQGSSSAMCRAPSRGRRTASASRSCVLGSLLDFDAVDRGERRRRTVNANWPGEEGRIVWPSLVAPWRPNLPPAWSPDGRLIAVVAVDIAQDRRTGHLREQRYRIRSSGSRFQTSAAPSD